MRLFLFSLLCIFILLPSSIHAEGLNAGFVQGLWYSSEPIFADKTVRIYVALRNNTKSDITGTVRFIDNKTVVGTKQVDALAGRLIETWTDWIPTYGDHTLEAILTNITLNNVGEQPTTTNVTSSLASDVITVDYDTDTDGIGNKMDEDDDNDGISDVEEKTQGTNPLVYDEPKLSEINTATPENNTNSVVENTATKPKGLERLVKNDTVNNILTNVTDTIHNTKQSLDTYRKKRNGRNELQNNVENTIKEIGDVVDNDFSGTNIRTLGVETSKRATITRTQIPTKQGLFSKAINIMSAIFSAFYTLILSIISTFLGFPALVELVLLLFIIIFIYRLARKLGRRPID